MKVTDAMLAAAVRKAVEDGQVPSAAVVEAALGVTVAAINRLTAERNALIEACITQTWRTPPGRPGGIEECWRYEIGGRFGLVATREEAIAAVRCVAGLGPED